MGTRGLFGFYWAGKYYLGYNHFDSYPNGLGAAIVAQIKVALADGTFADWLPLLKKLKIVNQSVPPTEEDVKNLAEFTDLSVSEQSTQDWYCLLRRCQGSLSTILKSGYLLNAVNKENGTPHWEEYAYVINFDTNKFDFYEGNILQSSFEFLNLPGWEEQEY